MVCRKILSATICIAFLIMNFMSCGADGILESKPQTEASRDLDSGFADESTNNFIANKKLVESELSDLELRLRHDPDVRELIAIRDMIIAKTLQSRISGEEMMKIVSHNDVRRFAEILGYTKEQVLNMGDKIAVIGMRIRDKYPELQYYAGNNMHSCVECEFEDIADKWDDLMAEDTNNIMLGDDYLNMLILPDPSEKSVNCQWAPYTAALVLCTAFGPLLYWPCAVVAICTFCSGGWVSSVCQN